MWKFLKETSGLAIFSILFAILFIPAFIFGTSETLGFALLIPPIAIILGLLSQIYIKKKELRGRLLAKIGIFLGILEIIIFIIVLLFAI